MFRKIAASSVLIASVLAIAPDAIAQATFDDSAVVEFSGDVNFDCQISATQNGSLRANTTTDIITQTRGRADINCNVPYKLQVTAPQAGPNNPSTTNSSVIVFTSPTGSSRFSGLGLNGVVANGGTSEITLNQGSRAIYPAVTAVVENAETQQLSPGIYSYSVLLSITNP